MAWHDVGVQMQSKSGVTDAAYKRPIELQCKPEGCVDIEGNFGILMEP